MAIRVVCFASDIQVSMSLAYLICIHSMYNAQAEHIENGANDTQFEFIIIIIILCAMLLGIGLDLNINMHIIYRFSVWCRFGGVICMQLFDSPPTMYLLNTKMDAFSDYMRILWCPFQLKYLLSSC